MMRKWSEEELRRFEQHRQEHQLVLEEVGAMLAGRPPQAQGAIIAELLSLWLAGWNPEVREEALSLLLKLAREMVPEQEKRASRPGS